MERSGACWPAWIAGLLLVVVAAGCTDSSRGSGGGGGGGGGETDGQSLVGTLKLVDHTPAGDAVQVAPDASILLTFDGVVVAACLRDPETYLAEAATGRRVPGTLDQTDGGRSIRFRPSSPLAEHTDYRFQVSPLTCDTTGRILEITEEIRFRTLDRSPPRLLTTSVRDRESGVSQHAPVDFRFDEVLGEDSADVRVAELTDGVGHKVPIHVSVHGSELRVRPKANLAGATEYRLTLGHGAGNGIVRDRVGNAWRGTWAATFTTAADTTPPAIVAVSPPHGTGMSPAIRPIVQFDEAIDLDSVESTGLTFIDQYSNLVPYTPSLSDDGMLLVLTPRDRLAVGRQYAVAIARGPGAITDLSGNPLALSSGLAFKTGDDTTPPRLVDTQPSLDETGVSVNVQPLLTFDEPLDERWVKNDTVHLLLDGAPQDLTVSVEDGGRRLRIVPAHDLEPGGAYTVRLDGGVFGVRDAAGNPLAAPIELRFRAAADSRLPGLIVQPSKGSIDVPTDVDVVLVFDHPLDPGTVGPGTVALRDDRDRRVPSTLALARGGRVVRISPTEDLPAATWFTLRVTGGLRGVRLTSGNGMRDDVVSTFRTGRGPDRIPPAVELTINDLPKARANGIAVPPYSFTIAVGVVDADGVPDLGSVEVEIQGPGLVPGSDAIFQNAQIDRGGLRWQVPAKSRLTPGDHRIVVRVADLSGNTATASRALRVVDLDPGVMPFERTQVVWARFDLDRDGNGRPDFEDDLLALGLIASGDPAGTNGRMLSVLRHGVMDVVHGLLHRAAGGAPKGADSVPMLVVDREPLALPHLQIAVGGQDPEGPPGRTFGAESTGVLGRAFFDYRNADMNDRNTQTRPGVGVFPGELLLYQARIHNRVYPAFVTAWARRFLKLAPAIGGTPAGKHELDAKVLAPGFDFGNATPAERKRYLEVFTAADDWAAAVGVVLAHEIGHAVGLTANDSPPKGLFGDGGFHNADPRGPEVMSPTIGYESLISLDYAYRDINIAYLRQRVLLK